MKFLVVIFTAIVLFGCVPIPYPHRVTDIPEVKGSVVNADTGKPVGNVAITLSKFCNREMFGENKKPVMQKTSKTNVAGEFVIEEEKHWLFFKFLWLGAIDFGFLSSELNLTYQIEPTDKPLCFSDPSSECFASRPVYNPHIIIGDNSTPRYGPYDFHTLKIKPTDRADGKTSQ